jgi:hypothetical protein
MAGVRCAQSPALFALVNQRDVAPSMVGRSFVPLIVHSPLEGAKNIALCMEVQDYVRQRAIPMLEGRRIDALSTVGQHSVRLRAR